MFYIIIIILNIIILSSFYVLYKRKLDKNIYHETKKYIEQNKQLLESEIRQNILELIQRETEQKQQTEEKWKELDFVNKQIALSTKQLGDLNQSLATQRENAKTYEESLRKLADTRVSEYEKEKFKLAEQALAEQMSQIAAQTNEARAQLEQMNETIKEYGAKQAAINEAIMRQRAIEEQQDFYKICLSNEAKSDINYLISIIPNFKNPTTLYKLIWSEYIQKQFNQMLKNVLGATDPRNVIYSITNLKTNEIYIGKTKAEVSKRWSEHVKSSLNIGTIKSAKIHEALYNHWDEFVFAIIEKVPLEENLSEREKFYIDFYQSNIYGYNLKSGG